MLLTLAAYGMASVLAPWLVRRWGSRAFVVLASVPGAAFVATATLGPSVRSGRPYVETVPWIPGLDVELAFRVDTLAWVMSLLVAGIGALVLSYCRHYFRDDEPGLGRFAGCLIAFAGTMHGLVVADDLLLLYVFWEATTIFSYLLIGHTSTRSTSRRAGLQALVVTTAGGLAMLVGLVMLVTAAGTTRLSEVVANPPTGATLVPALVLVLAGAVTKSALVPFHFWLPSAMAAPTPVSAYLHAAAMVKAGVYLVARLAPGFADVPGWRVALLTLGLATMALGGWRALRQHDLKLLLAYGTVSQLGFLVLVLALGSRTGALAGLTMLVAHAFFKAALFLTVGVVDHCAGTRDLRELSGLGRSVPVLAVAAALAAASMAGVPPMLGYVGKEAVLTALEHEPPPVNFVLLAGVVGSTVLTVAYTARFLWGAFASKPGVADTRARREPVAFVLPAVLLAALSLLGGLAASVVDAWLAPYADRLPAAPGPTYHLALWHGLSPTLALSAVTLLGGLGLFLAREPVARAQARVPALLDAEHVYRGGMRRLDRLAVWVTVHTQVGSLPVYLAVALSVTVAGVGGVLLATQAWMQEWRWWDSPVQGVLTLVIAFAAVAVTRVEKRFTAVVVVGVVGYSVGLVFALHGAPDLALTQFLVETITLVAFVLVLRRLPIRIGHLHGSSHRRLRALLAAAVGVVVMGATAAASAARETAPVSALWPHPAEVFGGGKNLVNVALVDIRAWDTLGEISVLVVAATGVASLIFIRHRTSSVPRMELASRENGESRYEPVRESVSVHAADPRTYDRDPSDDDPPSTSSSWLLAGRTLAPENRSIILEVVVRLIFHAVVVVSLFLLLSGHNNPGGGFAGGLVVGLALITRYLAGGRYELGEALPIDAGVVLGAGMVIAAGTAVAGLVFGGQVLESAIVEWNMPVFGHVKLVTSLFFDVGVYLVVIGMVLDVLRSLGAEVDREREAGTETPEEEGTTVSEPHRDRDPEADHDHSPRRGVYR
ncbi:MAG TPA: Na+/H+ antiporter subunit A [Nocardioidaceae bacterium]|nr:Na+/H+ antiporter subunit A [Nocardioidaceae bacterium]